MNRRKFFAFLPVAPAALMLDGARADVEKDQPYNDGVSIMISASKPSNRSYQSSLGFNLPELDTTRSVSMSVGKDGNLWLKTANGEWKKVMVE